MPTARGRRRHRRIDRAPRMQALRCPWTNRNDANSKFGETSTIRERHPGMQEYLPGRRRRRYQGFGGGFDGVYCAIGYFLVRAQPASPSQYGLMSFHTFGNEIE